MGNLFKIAMRNLLRYKRRTLLTASLIAIGVVFVLVFIVRVGLFQEHDDRPDHGLHARPHADARKGYVASIDNLPLNLNMKAGAVAKAGEASWTSSPEIEAWSPRIKFGGMFSNFTETTNIRLNGVDPGKGDRDRAAACCRGSSKARRNIKQGEILIPELLARGMKVKVGRHGGHRGHEQGRLGERQAVQGRRASSRAQPAPADGTATSTWTMPVEILRMEEPEISEIAVRLKDFGKLHSIAATSWRASFRRS